MKFAGYVGGTKEAGLKGNMVRAQAGRVREEVNTGMTCGRLTGAPAPVFYSSSRFEGMR